MAVKKSPTKRTHKKDFVKFEKALYSKWAAWPYSWELGFRLCYQYLAQLLLGSYKSSCKSRETRLLLEDQVISLNTASSNLA